MSKYLKERSKINDISIDAQVLPDEVARGMLGKDGFTYFEPGIVYLPTTLRARSSVTKRVALFTRTKSLVGQNSIITKTRINGNTILTEVSRAVLKHVGGKPLQRCEWIAIHGFSGIKREEGDIYYYGSRGSGTINITT